MISQVLTIKGNSPNAESFPFTILEPAELLMRRISC